EIGALIVVETAVGHQLAVPREGNSENRLPAGTETRLRVRVREIADRPAALDINQVNALAGGDRGDGLAVGREPEHGIAAAWICLGQVDGAQHLPRMGIAEIQAEVQRGDKRPPIRGDGDTFALLVRDAEQDLPRSEVEGARGPVEPAAADDERRLA